MSNNRRKRGEEETVLIITKKPRNTATPPIDSEEEKVPEMSGEQPTLEINRMLSNTSISNDSSSSEDESSEIYLLEDAYNLAKDNPDLKKTIDNIKENIKSTEPDLMKLLSTPMALKHKTELVMMYEIYKNMEPRTDDWFDYRKAYNDLYEEYSKGHQEFLKNALPEGTEEQFEHDHTVSNTISLKYKILGLETDHETKKFIYERYRQYSKMRAHDDEKYKIKHWLDWAISVPHQKMSQNPLETTSIQELLREVSVALDNELFGMQKVKEQILLFLNTKLLNPKMRNCNLGLIGPPGTGKTSIARLLARILKYPFQQISFGGVNDPTYLKGHDYTYVGSQPGEIVKCLRRMGAKNGILFFDEYEKASSQKGVSSTLLHITDPSQNGEFRDHFLEFPVDLSNIWQIYSMNSMPEDRALADRVFPVEISGYSTSDKTKILQNFLLPKALGNANLAKDSVTISRENASYLIGKVSGISDKGVRTIEKTMVDIINKINYIYKHQCDDGSLGEFKFSFKVGKKLDFPIELSRKLIDTFVETKETDYVIRSMYM